MISTNKEYYDKNFSNDNGFALNKDLVIDHHFKEAIKNAAIDDKYSLEQQVATALEIFSCCNPQYEQSNVKRTGNVTGKVQSGKTTSFALLAAVAADNGYQLIINTLGTKNNLVQDNLRSVKSILGCHEGSDSPWEVIEIAAENRGGIGTEAGNLASLLKANPHSRSSREEPVYIPLLKNTTAINKLIELIEGLNLATEDIKVLIIDDEVDSYGMNTKKYENDLSPTNEALGKLRDVCGIATYVGYSATSAAVQLSHVDNFMSPDFHVLLHPGKGYIGNRELFGNPPQILDEAAYKKFKFKPQIINLDVEIPITDRNGKIQYVNDKNRLQNTLYDAICDFLVTTQIYAERFPNNKDVKSMMIHPSASTGMQGVKPHELNHEECMRILEDFMTGILYTDLNSCDTKNINYKRIKHAYLHHKKHLTKFKERLPSFDNVVDGIKNMVNPSYHSSYGKVFGIQACNMTTPPDITWSIPRERIWFLVGGHKLSRGFVVKGLLTTWMPVEPKRIVADTMEQRGRFFGYKEAYADLIRIYLKPKTGRAFLEYILLEEDQWGTFEETRKKGIRLSDSDVFNVQVDSISSLTATNKIKRDINKIRHKPILARTLPFETMHQVPYKNKGFHDLVSNYLSSIKLSRIKQPNKFNATSKGQKFMHGNFPLQDVYDHLLYFILKICQKDEDKYLQAAIKHIKNNYLDNTKNKCDVVFFDDDDRNREIIFDTKEGIWCWPNYGYKSGPAKPLKNCDPKKDFCGDEQVIIANGFDPYKIPFDKESNFNTSIQIHKLNVHSKDETHKLKDLYGISIRLPH
tara:strand:+ start:3099 stop:5510 length:2412 start_codon:yes stop_codon:yes gene_type:complete